jgi:SAM-dependent methyltransferase
LPASPPEPSRADEALLALLDEARAAGYEFVTVTPETHGRVIARAPNAVARDLRGVFGWSLPFEKALLPAAMWDALEASGMALQDGEMWRSRVRISSIDDRLFLHSAFPTDGVDSVFLGPDSYRFVRFLRAEMAKLTAVGHIVDIGAGAGAGGIMAAALAPGARLTLTDINPIALRLARVNARHAGRNVDTIETAGLENVAGAVDLVIANPPFMADAAARSYRDGGGRHGAGLSLDWALEAASRLEPGGTMLLYTGSAIVDGRDAVREALADQLGGSMCSLEYSEIDPDIFGEQLGAPGYEDVERIAAIGAVIRKA